MIAREEIIESKRVAEALHEAQMELAHANRVATMGQLAASVAHEISQPIATARNNARAALRFSCRNPADMEGIREALCCVLKDIDRAGALINSIREQLKKSAPRKGNFDLNSAIMGMIALARNDMATTGVSVHTRLAEGLPPVEGDPVQLQQVVLNLILNAVEAMNSVDGRRELLISTEQDQAHELLVAVRDSGPGIDPEYIDRVFEPFYTTKASGTGMGLSICRSIIDAHGGRLWADANDPWGAVFQFTLPAGKET